MDDRVARAILERNILDRMQRAQDDIALLQKLATNPSLVLTPPYNPAVVEPPDHGCCVYHPTAHALSAPILGIGSTLGVVTYDPIAGVLFAPLTNSLIWRQINDGLTEDQYQSVNFLDICQDGSIFVGHRGPGLDNYIAYSPGVGNAFVTVYDQAGLNALMGVGSGAVLVALAHKDSENVAFAVEKGADTLKIFMGSGTSFAETINVGGWNGSTGDMSFGDGYWMLSGQYWSSGAHGCVYVLSEDLTAVIRVVEMPSYLFAAHVRADASGRTFNFGGGLVVAEDNATTLTTVTSSPLPSAYPASDPTGNYLMGSTSVGPGVYQQLRSDDGALNWDEMAADIDTDTAYSFLYVSDAGVDSSWLAAGGEKVFSTDNFGDSWLDITGNLTDIVATPALGGIGLVNSLSLSTDCERLPTQTEALVMSISETDPLSVHIEGGLVETSQGRVNVETTDLDISSYVPGTGYLYIGFQFDNTTGAWSIKSGPVLELTDTPTTASLPTADAGKTMIFFTRLVYGALGLCDGDLFSITATPINFEQLLADLTAELDELYVSLTADQTIEGIKTFSEFPLLPDAMPTTGRQAANKEYVDSKPIGQVAGVMRWTSDGGDTFELPDLAEAIWNAFDDGLLVDPLIYSLSSDRTQLVFDSGITAGHVVVTNYVVAQV